MQVKKKILIKRNIYLCFLLFFSLDLYNQNSNNADSNLTFKIFYHENNEKASEGYLKNGIPVGVWKNFYESGTLKSEGKRENQKPDSLWKFYSKLGVLLTEINYKNGVKDGWEKSYSADGLIASKYFYSKGLKQNYGYVYKSDNLIEKVHFVDNIKSGYSYVFDTDGNVISILNYTNGFIKTRDNINRKNSEGNKIGKWIQYFPCPEPCETSFKIKKEGRYVNGVKNGIFKEYEKTGELLSLEKWENGKLITDSEETKRLEAKTEFYANAKPKSIKNYFNGVLEGSSTYYNENGEIVSTEIYNKGNLIAKGIVLENGLREGDWIFYYSDGTIKAKGKYKEGLKFGEWIYYHPNGKKEQKGTYRTKERPHGTWTWWYDNSEIQRKEEFRNGKEDGDIIEYNDTGKVILKGQYEDGLKEGLWLYDEGDYKQEGEYITGERTGEWKHYYGSTNKLSFKGSFIDGIPVDKHIWYHTNGKKMLVGEFVGGLREGQWSRYDEEGLKIMTIDYLDGQEKKINGIKIKPKKEFDEVDIDQYKKRK